MKTYIITAKVMHITEEEKEIIKRFGHSSNGEISRTFCVRGDMPLYSLHYALERAFGFLNEHLHCFKLVEEDYQAITNNNAGEWRRHVGSLFKSIIRCDEEDFWLDDYIKGSFNNWRKKKYTYPYPIYKGFYHSKEEWQKEIEDEIMRWDDEFYIYENDAGYKSWAPYETFKERKNADPNKIIKFDDSNLELMSFTFERDPRELLETLTIEEISKSYKEIIYNYDYGDNWEIILSFKENEDEDLNNEVLSKKTPIMLSYEGYNLVEDIGNIGGYVTLLLTLFNIKEIHESSSDKEAFELDGKLYKWIDPLYVSECLDLSPTRFYNWAHSLEWDYNFPSIERWFD
ncbi:MAG: hypothetical protein SPL00_04900 [Bacilli bacterium]|nr:hypothetical protein [Bacilli bacterium]